MLVRKILTSAIAIAAISLAASSALAQGTNPYSSMDYSAGQVEYLNACAVCHGVDGTGGGPMADVMTVETPDLTMIAAANEGVFPTGDVIRIIDGRTGVRGHGGEMPIWGDRFKVQATPEAGEYGAELVVRGRILALAEYLESLQK